MKKLFLIGLIAFSLTGIGQQFTTLMAGTKTANENGTAFFVQQDNAFSVTVVWSGATGTLDGVVYVETSNDNANWEAYDGAFNHTLSTASGVQSFVDEAFEFRYIRLRYAKNNCTSVTITAYFNQNIKGVR